MEAFYLLPGTCKAASAFKQKIEGCYRPMKDGFTMSKLHTATLPSHATVPFICLCPRCNALAREESRKTDSRGNEAAIQFVCPSCGWRKVRWCLVEAREEA
jgi:hypothetical protein